MCVDVDVPLCKVVVTGRVSVTESDWSRVTE